METKHGSENPNTQSKRPESKSKQPTSAQTSIDRACQRDRFHQQGAEQEQKGWSGPATWSKVQSWLGWLATYHLKAGSPENISASLLESNRMTLGKSTRQARKQAPPKTRKGGSQTLRFIQTVPRLQWLNLGRSHCSMHSKTHSEPYSNWIQASNIHTMFSPGAGQCTKVTSRCSTVVCAARKYICNLWYGQVRWITGVSTVLN